MRGILTVLMTMFLALASQAEAQTQVDDNWPTLEMAQAALREGKARGYFPVRRPCQARPNEVEIDLSGRFPNGAFIEMMLPDRVGGRGFVWIASTRLKFYSNQPERPQSSPSRFLECCNEVFGIYPVTASSQSSSTLPAPATNVRIERKVIPDEP